jgi:hypothetical protein
MEHSNYCTCGACIEGLFQALLNADVIVRVGTNLAGQDVFHIPEELR